MTFVLIFSCCVTPLLIAFEPKGSEKERNWFWINIIVDSLFLMDILVVFNTAVYDQYF